MPDPTGPGSLAVRECRRTMPALAGAAREALIGVEGMQARIRHADLRRTEPEAGGVLPRTLARSMADNVVSGSEVDP